MRRRGGCVREGKEASERHEWGETKVRGDRWLKLKLTSTDLFRTEVVPVLDVVRAAAVDHVGVTLHVERGERVRERETEDGDKLRVFSRQL